MNAFARQGRRFGAAAVAGLLMAAAACTDRSPVDAGGERPDPTPEPGGTPVHLVAVTCTADVPTGKVECGSPSLPAGLSTDLVVGGQGQFIEIEGGTAVYEAGTFTVPVTVRNLIRQPLGTSNASTLALDPAGVRVFLEGPPVVTSGTGSVTAVPDGRSTFTATDQEYWQYNTVLEHLEVSAPKTWTFTMPTTVTGFRWTAYVSAVVPYPNGWVEIYPESMMLRPFTQMQVTGVVVNAVGLSVPGSPTITWSSPDPLVAEIDVNTGVVTPLRAGTIALMATSGSITGTAPLNVTGTTRIWEGDVSTIWEDGGNWTGGVAPVALDSVLIPVVATQYPSLVQNVQIAGVQVNDGASIFQNAFDLTASANVSTGLTGGISSTTGRLVLSGIAKTVQGVLPTMRVTGTYSLSANITTRAPLRVELGRLTNDKFRIQAVSQ
jgi:hypothetical protein